jgi:hypothetical protein
MTSLLARSVLIAPQPVRCAVEPTDSRKNTLPQLSYKHLHEHPRTRGRDLLKVWVQAIAIGLKVRDQLAYSLAHDWNDERQCDWRVGKEGRCPCGRLGSIMAAVAEKVSAESMMLRHQGLSYERYGRYSFRKSVMLRSET